MRFMVMGEYFLLLVRKLLMSTRVRVVSQGRAVRSLILCKNVNYSLKHKNTPYIKIAVQTRAS